MGSFLIYPLNDILLTKNILLLTESEKSLLCKGLILATPPKTLEYAEYLLPFVLHKQLVDNCPPFRPIMSLIKARTYNLAKFLVFLLEPITTKMYTVKISF